MTENTTSLAPTDAEIEALRDAFDWDGWTCQKAAQRAFAHAVLARWGTPAPASGETETCKCCGEGSARIVVRRECDTCTSVYAGVAEHRIQKSLAEPPAQEVLLNPDMPTQELRLHMGELTTDEVLVARAAIRWANSQQEARVPLDRIARDLLFDVKNRVNALVLLPSSERRESEIRIKQDIADFLAAPPAPEVRVPLSDAEALAIVRSVPALVTAEEEWLWAIREVEKYHDITAAQKAAP